MSEIEVTCTVCEQECEIPETNLCDMMEYLIGENKYSICCNCYQSPPKVDNKEYRTRWNKHFKEVDNGYRPHDTKVEHMVRQLYNRDWL